MSNDTERISEELEQDQIVQPNSPEITLSQEAPNEQVSKAKKAWDCVVLCGTKLLAGKLCTASGRS
jgi:hypothetical protein